jgi:signal transduction histidine kinase
MIVRAAGEEEKVRTWARRSMDALERADRMITDLLDASRVEAGEQLPLKLEPCDLRRVAVEVCEELSLRHGNRFVLESTGSTTGFWSRDALRRVLENLLSNAVKYGDPQAAITTRIVGVDEHVLLSVHNHGTIIPAEEQQHLFQAFRRAGAAQASGMRGWGLGLTLVQGLVEAHGGMVKVESYPKEGTTFTVDLPADPRTGVKPGSAP